MRNGILWATMLTIAGANLSGSAMAQQPKQPPATGTQSVIHQAAQDGKYTFLMFYKQKDTPSNAMAATLKETLANNPRLILADEPTGNLDPDSREAVLAMFDNFVREGRTIVMVTHDPAAAGRAARRLCLSDGEVLEARDLDAKKAA